MGIREYIDENYKLNFDKLKGYINKSYKNKLNKYEIEDIYHEAICKVLTITTDINNNDGYFWIALRNQITFYLKNKRFGETLEDLVEEENTDKYADNFLEILNNNIKSKLTQIEYHIYINYTYNRITYKNIANQLGYSQSTVYQKTKKIHEIIRKELVENEHLYTR